MEANCQAVLKALSNTNRLRIVELLAASDEGLFAQQLLEQLDITQPTLSHHMKSLVACGIVAGQDVGRWRKYTFDAGAADEFLAGLEEAFSLE